MCVCVGVYVCVTVHEARSCPFALARSRHLCSALLGELRKGSAAAWVRRARTGARLSSTGEVRPGAERERLHAVLPRTQGM